LASPKDPLESSSARLLSGAADGRPVEVVLLIKTALEDTNVVGFDWACPGECPPQTSGSSCTVSCNSDSNCPNNEKCCSNGCGRYCTAPFTVKPGQCPKPKRVPECAESCFHDGQCPATQKCCPTTCGHVCSEPHDRESDQGSGYGQGRGQGSGYGQGSGQGSGYGQGRGQGVRIRTVHVWTGSESGQWLRTGSGMDRASVGQVGSTGQWFMDKWRASGYGRAVVREV
ncbi:hypothetical protein cypCar_00020666, partial [Cyprinus carpio]